MTTLLAYHDGERGWVAADRRSLCGGEVASDQVVKITAAGKWLIAATGPSLANAILRERSVDLAPAKTPWELGKALKQVFEQEGYCAAVEKPGGTAMIDASFVAASPEGSFTILSNFLVLKQDRPCCGGSGGSVAVGALTALLEEGVPAADAMSRAIKIAEFYSCESGGEPLVHSTSLKLDGAEG